MSKLSFPYLGDDSNSPINDNAASSIPRSPFVGVTTHSASLLAMTQLTPGSTLIDPHWSSTRSQVSSVLIPQEQRNFHRLDLVAILDEALQIAEMSPEVETSINAWRSSPPNNSFFGHGFEPQNHEKPRPSQ